MQKIILIGGGGHARSCIDVIEKTGLFEIVGILDVAGRLGEKVFSYSIVGTDNDIAKWALSGASFLITLGQVGTGEQRAAIYARIKAAGGHLITVISPRAYVSSRAKIGEGTIVMHDALVNTGASIGVNCIINTKALVEHDARVEDHCHLATGCVLNGSVHLAQESFIGSGAVVVENRVLAARTFVKAGSVWSKPKVENVNA